MDGKRPLLSGVGAIMMPVTRRSRVETEVPADPQLSPILLGPDEGRSYVLGSMRAVFKADEEETSSSYSISEWWLEPHSMGPGPHSHAENDDLFYVIEGTMTFLVGDDWTAVQKGGFVRAPRGVQHDFRNDTAERAGFLNIYVPGGFEKDMPAIVDWFAKNPS